MESYPLLEKTGGGGVLAVRPQEALEKCGLKRAFKRPLSRAARGWSDTPACRGSEAILRPMWTDGADGKGVITGLLGSLSLRHLTNKHRHTAGRRDCFQYCVRFAYSQYNILEISYNNMAKFRMLLVAIWIGIYMSKMKGTSTW